MFDVELTPAASVALGTVTAETRRRFFLVADYLKGRPVPASAPSTFWNEGEHFDIVRPPVIYSGIFMHDIRVIYHVSERVNDGVSPERNVIRIYAWSEGPNPLAGWEYSGQ